MHSIPIQQLTPAARPQLLRHFLSLDAEDRRLRFGVALHEGSIAQRVACIDFIRDDVFGVFDDQLELVGVAHLALTQGSAELGLSVLPEHRGKGVGGALLRRAHERARNRFVRKLFVHCLAENKSMLRLAHNAGMKVVIGFGDADAFLDLPPADPVSITGELWQQHVALFDFALKAQLHALHRLQEGMAQAIEEERVTDLP